MRVYFISYVSVIDGEIVYGNSEFYYTGAIESYEDIKIIQKELAETAGDGFTEDMVVLNWQPFEGSGTS